MVKDNSKKGVPKDTKGKGIATHLDNISFSTAGEDVHSDSAEDIIHTPSIISRLGASASKLTNDMILRYPSRAQVADTLPLGKAESSGASEVLGMQEVSTYKDHHTLATVGGTFKSTQSHEQSTSEEANFSSFLDGTSLLEATQPGHIESHGYEQNYGTESRHTSQATKIMPTDGMDVVSLLDSGYDGSEEINMPLTDGEQVALRYRLFENDETLRHPLQREQWEDVLNFFPDFKSTGNGIQAYADLLGTSDLEEARSIWINQWQHVLSSYTDEVWGDLSPLVDVAREELSSLSKPREASPSRPKALRRLQQILTQVRGI
ncbi:hypothetical protein F4804DRAFT_307940 [Jackrogersella minutella]|nr:hypothetical protein F4804DRAFT_307940 [Jackrogersella minutella]